MAQPNEAAVESSNKDSVTEEEFNEQAYLLFNYEQIAKGNFNETYKNFVQLSGNPSVLLSKLLGSGVGAFFSITPAEMALLVPKIRLYKTVISSNGKETDIEIPFNETQDNLRLETITRNREQRGSGVGLKSFDWEDLGTNPGDTGKAFKATLTMIFASIADIFVSFGKGVEEVTYADLIRFAPRALTNKDTYNDSSFRIKAQVGWQVPNTATEVIKKSLKEALENSFVTLFLTLTNHQIDIKENGSVLVTAEYMGAIEGKMLSPDTNILYIGRNNEEALKQKDRTIRGFNKQLEKKSEHYAKAKKDDGFFSGNSDAHELVVEEEETRRLLNEAILSQDAFAKENRLQSYSNLFREIYNRKRAFSIDVDVSSIELFARLRKEKFDPDLKKDELEKEKIKILDKFRKEFEKVAPTPYCAGPEAFNNSLASKENMAGLVVADEEKRQKAINEKANMFSSALKPQESNKHRINFIYFGDLVDAALQIMFNKLDEPQDNVDPIIAAAKRSSIENFRFILGSFQFHDIKTDKIYNIDLSDVPISLTLFNVWFLKKVIEPGKPSYLLRDFLRDVCAELIVKSLSPTGLGAFSKALRNRVSISVFSLNGGPKNPLHSSKDTRGSRRIHINDIGSATDGVKYSADPSNTLQYLMIYVTGLPTREMRGEQSKDMANGVPHFVVGSDRGPMKKLSFTRVNMPYVKESRILNSEAIKEGDVFFSEPYNAKIELMGTPHLKPGMLIYIEPSSIGFPDSVPKAKRLPLGGYHTIIKVLSKIESGRFNTTIDTNWEAFGEGTEEASVVRNNGSEVSANNVHASSPNVDSPK